MVTLNGTDYRLCLLDTNAVSEMVKREHVRRHFLTWSVDAKAAFVPCFSLFTVLELRRKPVVYQRFIELFRVIPCMVLKSHEQLLEEETSCYPDPSRIDPSLLGFSPLGGEGMDLERVLSRAEEDELFGAQERYWNASQDGIVEGVTSLVANFPPEAETYSRSEVRGFVEISSFSQLAMRQRAFAEEVVGNDEAVEMAAFPSLKATTYTVWHKFYADATRKPSRSDAFDIVISAATPYVEAIVTENHQAEALRKTKRLDGFIKDLIILTLRDFRNTAPVTPSALLGATNA
jgi:hypothetical protein